MASLSEFVNLFSFLNNPSEGNHYSPRNNTIPAKTVNANNNSNNPFQEAVNDRAVHTSDQDFFVVDGIECVVKNIYRFNWCAYVKLPSDHPDFLLNQRQMNSVYNVHSGISYCQDGSIGFSTVNDNDYCLMREMTRGVSEANLKYRSYNFVKLETIRLAKQIYERYVKRPQQKRRPEALFSIFMDAAGKSRFNHRSDSMTRPPEVHFSCGSFCAPSGKPQNSQPSWGYQTNEPVTTARTSPSVDTNNGSCSPAPNLMDLLFSKEPPECCEQTSACGNPYFMDRTNTDQHFGEFCFNRQPEVEPNYFSGQKTACQDSAFYFGPTESCGPSSNFNFETFGKNVVSDSKLPSTNCNMPATNCRTPVTNCSTPTTTCCPSTPKNRQPENLLNENVAQQISKALENFCFNDYNKSQCSVEKNTNCQPKPKQPHVTETNSDFMMKLVDEFLEGFGKQFLGEQSEEKSSEKSEGSDKNSEWDDDDMPDLLSSEQGTANSLGKSPTPVLKYSKDDDIKYFDSDFDSSSDEDEYRQDSNSNSNSDNASHSTDKSTASDMSDVPTKTRDEQLVKLDVTIETDDDDEMNKCD